MWVQQALLALVFGHDGVARAPAAEPEASLLR
jgi:hypothetical protein